MNTLIKIKTILHEDLENLIKSICKDLDKEEETEKLINKYLNIDMKKIFIENKNYKNKRRKTAYSMFLKYNNIRKNNPEMSLEEYNIYKGEYWKNISIEEKNLYENKAEEWNTKYKNNLVEKKEDKKKKKQENKDIFDCFFDEEYIKDKNLTEKLEII